MTMPLLFFQLNECGAVTEDPDGREVANLDAAWDVAIRAARAVMCAELDEGRLCLGCHIDVIDADGAHLLRVPFREAVTITGM